MSVWFCIPSKRPPDEANRILSLWVAQGYKVAVLTDVREKTLVCHYQTSILPYMGYARSVNYLVAEILMMDPECDWVVTGGDDVAPDMNHTADEIARECSDHFRNCHIEETGETFNVHPTYGVMQPTGDRWGDAQGAYIDRVCGSPWLGREFCTRVNRGNGPLWPEYPHMFVDEELQAVATRLGVLWQTPDLVHLHKHWGRVDPGKVALHSSMPEFLRKANMEMGKYRKLFETRKAAGFPGSEVL